MTAAATLRPAPVLATTEVPRHAVRLLVIDGGARPAGGEWRCGSIERDRTRLTAFATLPELLRRGDLVVVNDAATLPASLFGRRGADRFELRLSGPIDQTARAAVGASPAVVAARLEGVLLGEGDYRTRTEHRQPPPALVVGDRVEVATLDATVAAAHGRRVTLAVAADPDALWQAIYASGVPVQYAHRVEPLALWSVQTAYATRPWAAEMPSAGRALTWDVLLGLRRAGIAVAGVTHAAGLSSTGEAGLDRALPWAERYEIPVATAQLIADTRARGGRVIAIGTTVVRALEASGGRAGLGVATLRLDASYAPRIVDGLVSGLHEPGESHFELLSAFAPRERLLRAHDHAVGAGLSGHELGDACLIL